MRKRFERSGIYGEKLDKYNKNIVKMPYFTLSYTYNSD